MSGTTTTTEPNEELETIKAELAAAKAELAAAKAKPAPTATPSPTKTPEDLVTKARKEIESRNKTDNNVQQLEKSLKFNLEVDSFVKSHKGLLPNEVEKIIEVANKETYDSAMDKTNAIKVGLVSSFFSVQSNLDVLTASQKSKLDDFQKLSKKGKEERVTELYETVFEPAIETFKRIKKAEEVVKARSGIVSGSSTEDAYKQKMINFSKKAYLKETNV